MLLPWSSPMWEEWLATFVPFGVATLLALALLRRIRARSTRLSGMFPALRWPARQPRNIREPHVPTEVAEKTRTLPEAARVFTVADRTGTGFRIGLLCVSAVAIVGVIETRDPAWKGLAAIIALLIGLPMAFIGALCNAVAATVALRRSQTANFAAAALTGAAVGVLLEVLLSIGEVGDVLLPGLPHPALLTPTAMIVPIAMAAWCAVTEWRLYRRARKHWVTIRGLEDE